MSNDKSNDEKRNLGIDDPVPPEVLQQLGQIQEARGELAERNVVLDQEKIQILAAMKRLDDQRIRLFEAILTERGLAPRTLVQIDRHTGKLRLVQPPKASPAPQEAGEGSEEAQEEVL